MMHINNYFFLITILFTHQLTHAKQFVAGDIIDSHGRKISFEEPKPTPAPAIINVNYLQQQNASASDNNFKPDYTNKNQHTHMHENTHAQQAKSDSAALNSTSTTTHTQATAASHASASPFSLTSLKNMPHTVTNYVSSNKLVCALIALGITYGVAWSSLMIIYMRMLYHQKWGLWQPDYNIQYIQDNKAQVAALLFEDIQATYRKAAQDATFLHPLFNFMKEVDAELYCYEQFLSFHATLDKIYLAILFPAQEKAQAQAYEHKMRLELLKSILLDWIAQTKLE